MRTLSTLCAALALAGCDQVDSLFPPSAYCKALIDEAVSNELWLQDARLGKKPEMTYPAVIGMFGTVVAEQRKAVVRECGDRADREIKREVERRQSVTSPGKAK